jgi:hypothetical protein
MGALEKATTAARKSKHRLRSVFIMMERLFYGFPRTTDDTSFTGHVEAEVGAEVGSAPKEPKATGHRARWTG